jgi:uncharacterized protein
MEYEMEMSAVDMFDRVRAMLARTPEVEFAYLFGSHARGDAGALSDIDIAVFFHSAVSSFNCRLRLMESLARELGTERFDLITLNAASIVLKYEVILGGMVIKEAKERRIGFEAKTLGEYLDTAHLRHTQEAYLKAQLIQGDFRGQ